jgi:hypothetical protein
MAKGYPINPGVGEYDFTEGVYQNPLRYEGFDSGPVAEAKKQRQEWQARLLRENPNDMDLELNRARKELEAEVAAELEAEEAGGSARVGGYNVKTPGQSSAELDKLLKEFF